MRAIKAAAHTLNGSSFRPARTMKGAMIVAVFRLAFQFRLLCVCARARPEYSSCCYTISTFSYLSLPSPDPMHFLNIVTTIPQQAQQNKKEPTSTAAQM